jgi:hypothetical protein
LHSFWQPSQAPLRMTTPYFLSIAVAVVPHI